MVELCRATVTHPVPRGPRVSRLEDSVSAGSMSSADNAQSAPLVIMDSHTADVSEHLSLSSSVYSSYRGYELDSKTCSADDLK